MMGNGKRIIAERIGEVILFSILTLILYMFFKGAFSHDLYLLGAGSIGWGLLVWRGK